MFVGLEAKPSESLTVDFALFYYVKISNFNHVWKKAQ